MPDQPNNPPGPPHGHAGLRPPESTRSITAQALKFLGLIVVCGGALAVLRLHETKEEVQSWFYALLMPVGLVMWIVGFYLSLARAGAPHVHAGLPHEDIQNPSSKK
jgi:hypothetical protein